MRPSPPLFKEVAHTNLNTLITDAARLLKPTLGEHIEINIGQGGHGAEMLGNSAKTQDRLARSALRVIGKRDGRTSSIMSSKCADASARHNPAYGKS